MKPKQLPLFPAREQSVGNLISFRDEGVRAIEERRFPFEKISEIAEAESWRKEIARPVYHVHKWWAQRLGSVFRAIVLSTFAPAGTDVIDLFYSAARVPDVVVFDPFMGSGTTLGESLKVGARAVGRDINPVAYFAVRNALGMPSREQILRAFAEIEHDVTPQLQRFYEAKLPGGRRGHALYYFWVKQIPCPKCHGPVDLFSSYIFVAHAYPGRRPDARAVCPACQAINLVHHDAERVTCKSCGTASNPQSGPARGQKATCPSCRETFLIAKIAKEQGHPPTHRMYAKLVLTSDDEKMYLPADEFDLALYESAARDLEKRPDLYPVAPITPGYNTNQSLNYSYKFWHQMFNARQLLCLGVLAQRIRAMTDSGERNLFACLFSGVLEFNNMFTSFKGEGTGAVRHMFYHHILKPERTPLEANVWGTPRSSGSFSTLFRTRILRALDYCENPFELTVSRQKRGTVSGKTFGLSLPIFHESANTFSEFEKGMTLYLSCGDSARTDVAPQSVDAVITDPPFFDNVHYSELADFFYVWQRHVLGPSESYRLQTTRSEAEVQTVDALAFTARLSAVWQECHRVLKPDGLLVFTYHHSRPDGWRCVLESLVKARFTIVRAHPVKAEMSGAAPKHQAREPIDLDMVMVCRKRRGRSEGARLSTAGLLSAAVREAEDQVRRLRGAGRRVSRSDVKVVMMAQSLIWLSRSGSVREILTRFDARAAEVDELVDRLE